VSVYPAVVIDPENVIVLSDTQSAKVNVVAGALFEPRICTLAVAFAANSTSNVDPTSVALGEYMRQNGTLACGAVIASPANRVYKSPGDNAVRTPPDCVIP
jgi:hypothetical protein